jgi:hypothetical protein
MLISAAFVWTSFFGQSSLAFAREIKGLLSSQRKENKICSKKFFMSAWLVKRLWQPQPGGLSLVKVWLVVDEVRLDKLTGLKSEINNSIPKKAVLLFPSLDFIEAILLGQRTPQQIYDEIRSLLALS